MDAATIVRRVRALSGISRKELAELADVSPSTVGRIERGEMDPTWGTLSRILTATGYQLSGDTVVSSGDTSAVVAARPWIDAVFAAVEASSRALAITPTLVSTVADVAETTLRERRRTDVSDAWRTTLQELTASLNPMSALTDAWWARWRRAGWLSDKTDIDSLVSLAVSAGNAAKISRRNAVQRAVEAPNGWQALVRELGEANVSYAVSGLVAAREGRATANANMPVVYVSDPIEVVDRFSLAPTALGQGVLLVEAIDRELDDVEIEEGIQFVPRTQAVLDALGGSGREPDKAVNELRKMLTTA